MAAMERTRHPGIYKRGERYVVVWRHRGKQHKSFHRTLAEAREAKGQRQAGDSKPATRATLEDYARAWIDGYQGRTSRGFTEQARGDYRRSLEVYVFPFFAGWRMADVEPPDARRFVRSLEEKGLAPASVKKNLRPLSAMFATAMEDGELRANPFAGLRVNGRRGESEEEAEAKALTADQLARLLAAAPERWRLVFHLLAKSGLRISEALGLEWSDVVFGARPMLKVRRQYYRGDLRRLKTRNGRRDVPLSGDLARALWAARPARAEGAVFTAGTGARLMDRNVRRAFDQAAKDAGVEWATLHTLRHTCASMLIDSGKNIAQVARWLGHSNPAFTLSTYVHLMDAGLGDADCLDAAVGNAWATQHPETPAPQTSGAAAEYAA